jgi:Zn ribbon nucleic-acid-binding protein
MSGTSGDQTCPKCFGENTLMIYYESRPHDSVAGECIQCGYSYWTERGRMDLEEVNEMRADRELKPLKALKTYLTEDEIKEEYKKAVQ